MPSNGDIPYTHANVSLAFRDFSFKPTIDLPTGLRKFVKCRSRRCSDNCGSWFASQRVQFDAYIIRLQELAEPSIRDAFQSCVQRGAHRIIVSPFFLSPGRHWSQDIPSLSAEAAKEHPDVSYNVTAPLGLHELLVDVVNDRIKHCIKHVARDVDECSVCAGTAKCRLY
ncbi:sirohydrochlorin ferrochelatase, chloroplastic [Vigna radiata var. radiata]|uniref:Sirohydrochlorin ferrochelatase, chloroplastic n=1 Tax=Vigna radiata var. radiata TaxID=3916 RepID=A0A3Q0FHA9_VIGRR|nr:sirohydrochlorin ferrochelatase, chloroplastic [Vigna radiata var. radiata]